MSIAVDLAVRHHAADLFDDPVDRDAFGRIDFYRNRKFFSLQLPPELAFGLARL